MSDALGGGDAVVVVPELDGLVGGAGDEPGAGFGLDVEGGHLVGEGAVDDADAGGVVGVPVGDCVVGARRLNNWSNWDFNHLKMVEVRRFPHMQF